MKNTDILNYLKCNYTLTSQAILLHISGASCLCSPISSLYKYSLNYNLQQPNKNKLIINFQIGVKIQQKQENGVWVLNVQ